MKTSQDLELELKQAKEREKQDSIQADLENNLHFKGKCFATHLLQRKNPKLGTIVTFRKITDVGIKNDQVVFFVSDIQYQRLEDKGVKFNTERTYYQRPFDFHRSFEYEITPEQFESAKLYTEAVVDIIGDVLKKSLKTPHDYITNGTHTDETNEVELMLASGMPIIKLPEERCEGTNLSIRELLNYRHHPLIISGRFLVNNQYSRIILEKIISDMENSARSWGGVIWERDYPRVQALRSFLNDTIWV